MSATRLFNAADRAAGQNPDRADLRAQIRRARVQMLCQHVPAVMVMAVGFAMVLGWLLHEQIDPIKVWTWFALRTVVVACRVVQARLYLQRKDHTNPIWYGSFLALVLVDGILWGAAWWWLVPVDRLDLTAITLTAILGVGGLSAFILHADVRATATHVLAMLLPCAAYSLTRHDSYGVFGAVSLTAFTLLLLLETHRAYVRLFELLTLRFEHERILGEREQALALAQHHSEAKSRFLASMSHEMRTPLHGILGLSRLLHDDEVRPVALRRLELLERSGDHLLTVINDVLDVSKIEAGHVHIEQACFDLSLLIDEVAGVSTVTANRKGLHLRLRTELPEGYPVIGDAMRLRQVLHNLLGNAIKFTEQGHVTLYVQLMEGQRVSFMVQDTGVGIPEDKQQYIFDAFHQVENGLGKRHGGTGLGLTISRELCRAMGGDLRCRSEKGVGSTFECILSLPPSSERPATRRPQRRAALTAACTVLLVEDNPINALVAEAALRQIGADVQVVDDGRKAIDWLARQSAHLVLMDCQLPVMDGFEAARLIREQERSLGLAAVPIVALTANIFPGERQRCVDAGMNDYLGKPFRREDLHAVLMRHTGHTLAELPQDPSRAQGTQGTQGDADSHSMAA
ncbi:MAG: response regulator [Aquabacterium sp.]|uniref:ATP-binding protein n=1 Tax=Aquabacterium sp. TaxID=1872578 RepID=UPI0011F6FE28|nr:ATP-binding protein [Aquabacterium sp.]TAK95924.1 MAG: response regulator [Aquabacterium sp.]